MGQPGIDPWGVAAAPAGPTDPWGTQGSEPFGEDEAKGALNLATSGAQVTSQKRSQADNTRVGGVPNSMHLSGQAMDFVLPQDTDASQVRAELERQGYPVTEWLIEKKGDPHSTGDHVHWGWGAKGGALQVADNTNVDPWGVASPAASPPPSTSPTNTPTSPSKPSAAAPPEASWAEILSPNVASAWDRIKQAGIGLGEWAFNEAMPEITPEMRAHPKFNMTPSQQVALEKTRAPVNAWFDKARADVATDLKANTPDLDPGTAKSYAYQTLAGLTEMVPVLAATAVTKDPLVGASIMAGQAGGDKYADALANGRSREQASMDASFSAMTNGAMGLLPLHILMKPGGTFLGNTLKNAGAFGLQNVVTEALQIGYDKGLVNPDMTLKEALDRLEQAGITGALTGALLGSGHHAFTSAVNRFRTMPAPAQPATPEGAPSSVPAEIGLPTPGRAPEPDPWAPAAEPSFRTTPGSIADEHALEVARLEREGAEAAARSTPPARPPADEFTAFLNRQGVIPGEGSEAPVPPSKAFSRDENEIAKDEFWNAPPPSLVRPEAPEPRAALPENGGIPRRDLEADTAITASGREVPVRYAVVEASHLVPSQTQEGNPNPNFPAELQPRDRTRAVSQAQIASIAQNINPRLLGESVNASDGAPIISSSGIVESGNGRTLAIQRAYGGDLPSAQRYRDYLQSQGYPVEGMTAPVLVRVREGEMSPEDRKAFVREANQSGQLGYSATERAMSDAASLPEHILDSYRGGDVESAQNRDFVRSFMRAAIPENEHAGMIDAHGALSQQATQRIRAALLAKAYGDPDLVARVIESPDGNVKAIGGALGDVSAEWAKMRARANDGQIPPALDQTGKLLEAVNLVARARSEGRNVAEYVAQPDIFTGKSIDPDVEAWLRLMFRDTRDWTKPVGREKLADALKFYATEAQKAQSGPDMLGNRPLAPNEVLAAAKAKQERQYGSPTPETGPSLSFGEDVRAYGGQRGRPGAQGPEAGRGQGFAETGSERADENDLGSRVEGFKFAPAGAEGEVQHISPELDAYLRAAGVGADDTSGLYGAVANFVRERGLQNGTESLVFHDGDRITGSTSNARGVAAFAPDVRDRLNDPSARAVTFHNHPGSGAPSNGDLTTLSMPGHGALVVVAHDGNWYAVKAAFRSGGDVESDTKAIHAAAQVVRERVFDTFQNLVNRGILHPEEAMQHDQHIINAALAHAGITDYRTSFRPRGDLERLVKTLISGNARYAAEAFDNNGNAKRSADALRVYRPAKPVRLADGIADLLGTSGHAPGQPSGEAGARGNEAESRAAYRKPEQLKLLEDENRYERERPIFYSALSRGIADAKMTRAPAKDWLGYIENLKNKGVKNEEIDWSGIKDWLQGRTGPVSKEDVQKALAENEVRVEEVLRGAPKSSLGIRKNPDGGFDVFSKETGDILETAETQQEAESRASTATKFAQYTLPGGERYRELLLTLPHQPIPRDRIVARARQIAQDEGDSYDSAGKPRRELYEAHARSDLERKRGTFQSGHFDEPNVLAHIRFDDRTGANGEKVLHISEVQSDWHQKGRREGYTSPNPGAGWHAEPDVWRDGIQRGWNVYDQTGRKVDSVAYPSGAKTEADAVAQVAARTNVGKTQNAPFKQSWHELAMRRALRYAAEHGYDKLSWDTGETQADRYDLSKQVDFLLYKKNSDGTYRVSAMSGGRGHPLGEKITEAELESHVGKDVAKRIVDGVGSEQNLGGPGTTSQPKDIWKGLEGENLKVGGEGMRGFYDRILPQFMSKYVKKWGGRVGRSQVATNTPTETYKGPEPTKEQIQAVSDAIHARASDQHFVSPITRERQGYQINRVANESSLRDVLKEVERGKSFTDAMADHGSDDLAKIFGGEKVRSTASGAAPAHSVDITPEMRESVMGGQALFEDKNRYEEEPGATDAQGRALPQTVIPGAEASAVQLAKAREASGKGLKTSKAAQKEAGPLFGPGEGAGGGKQGSLFEEPNRFEETPAYPTSHPTEIFRQAIRRSADNVMDLVHDAQMLVAPMAEGSSVARATAKTFANAMRLARWHGQRMDQQLKTEFTPDQRRKMWEAADQESVARQEGRPTTGIGLSTLTPEERRAVLEQQQDAQNVWKAAQDQGTVSSEGLPSYVPRMMVEVAHTGVQSLGSGDAGRSIPGIGRNLRTRTAQMLRRKHLTAEGTETSASTKFGTPASIVRDIRTLPLATARLREAVAGRALINKIKEIGKATGDDTVVEGHDPSRGDDKWFHLNHPSFFTWRPKFVRDPESGEYTVQKDQNGDTVLEKTPIWVRGDFEGPLRAVLSQDSGKLYNAMMDLKGRAMTTIMYSPLIHNAVEWGRALPAMPGKVATFRIYFEGNRAKRDPEQMTQAIMHGLVPIGHQGGFQDITSIATRDNIRAGRSWTAKVLGAIPGLFDPRAKEAVYRAIDRMGDIWHNTLLWDRVGDLQMGLYTNFRDDLTKKGYAPDTAQYVAAHFANRYAGALPVEAMSSMSRKIANLTFFSRTFTLGNLGAMKDVFTGLPRDVQAQIEQSATDLANAKVLARSMARRKALAILATDIALFYAGNSLLQSAIAYISGQKDLSEIEKGYADRLNAELHRVHDNPLELLNPFAVFQNLSATSENEQGREDRVYVGTDHNGTAIYARNPVGKIGEEFKNWLTQPLDTIKKKLSPFARPTYEAMTNDAGFGRHVYDPDAKGISGHAGQIGDIVWNYMKALVPLDSLKSAYKLATGTGGEIDTYKTLGPLAGVTFSKGAPGGPAVGYAYQLEREHQAKVQAGMPDVIEKIKNGDIQGARTDMKALGISPGLANWYVRTTVNPKLKMNTRKMREMLRSATPEERARLQELRGANP